MSEPEPETPVLRVHKRGPLKRDEHVPDAKICISEGLPASPTAVEGIYCADGEAIANRLWDSLPGGTIDRLIIRLLERRATLLRVGFLSIDEAVRLAETPEREPRWAKGQRVEFAESICEREPDMCCRGGTVLSVTPGALDLCQVLFDGEVASRVMPETYLVEHQQTGCSGADVGPVGSGGGLRG